MITGERPYGGLNLFVVAYGVGHGTLSLPIPDGCPEPLSKLMEGKSSIIIVYVCTIRSVRLKFKYIFLKVLNLDCL